MTRLYRFADLVVSLCVLAVFAGCTTEEDVRARRVDLAVRHFDRATYKAVPEKVLTLKDCVALALEHNFDIKASRLEEDVADTQKVAELLRMLPQINFNYTGTRRDSYAATSSQKKEESGASYGASTSQDKGISLFNLDFALSVMDFGLAFFNAQQAKDRALMVKQRNNRLVQNLILDVAKVYFNVVVYQQANAEAKKHIENCKKRAELISSLEKSRRIDPFRAFEERRKFNNMERRLEYYTLQYENAAVELRSLLGFYATSKIKVDDSILLPSNVQKLKEFQLPKMDLMEQIALLNRPEMIERNIQKHINAVECRKIILSMFPTSRLFIDFNASSNSFLYNQSWWDMGINSAVNLMKLPMKTAQLYAQGKTVDAEEVKAYGQAITVMAQVRIAHAEMLKSKEIYELDNKIRSEYNQLYVSAKANKEKSGSPMSELDMDHMHMQLADSTIQRTISLSNYYLSLYRLMNAMGLENAGHDSLEDLRAELTKLEKAAEKVISNAGK